MKIILAIDSFKGCLTSQAAEAAAERGVREQYPSAEILKVPVTDGGDGMLNVFCELFECDKFVVDCHDALMRPIRATFAVRKDGVCILETAVSCGINLLKADELNPLRGTTYGVGELMIAAIKHGCRDFIIGLGGSATSDCGLGMLRAFKDEYGEEWYNHPQLKSLRIRLASDVDNPLYGPKGAALIFGSQKGATESDIVSLDRRAMTFATMSAKKMGKDCSGMKGAGAAGGLGYAFMEFFNTEKESGADLLLREAHFSDLIAGADLIITGEGSADKQTLMGKIPQKVLQLAQSFKVPVHLIAGRVLNEVELVDAGFASVSSINPADMPKNKVLKPDIATENIRNTVSRIVKNIYK